MKLELSTVAVEPRNLLTMNEAAHKRRPANWGKHWSEEDLDYLANRYGLLCDETLATQLQRTESAIITTARKKYSISHIDNYNYYTAATLAEALGINESSIHLWIKKGWLKGRRPSNTNGKRRVWRLVESSIVKCLRQHPWLAMLNPTPQWLISDYSHHLFYIVREEWERDPWYTVEQAAPLLGLSRKSKCEVSRYIHMGWLRAEKKPCVGSSGGAWIIRRSAIRAFLENDPRPDHWHSSLSAAKIRHIIRSGGPARRAVIWVIKCPACGQEVTITASPQLSGHEIHEMFIDLYVNGNCKHGTDCLIPLKKGVNAKP